jgi:hypothetical protein
MKTLGLILLGLPWISITGAVAHWFLWSKRQHADKPVNKWRKFRGHGEVIPWMPFQSPTKLIPGFEIVKVLR